MEDEEAAGRDEEEGPLSPLSPPLPAPPPDSFATSPGSGQYQQHQHQHFSSPDNSLSRRSVVGAGGEDDGGSVASSRVRHLPEPGQTQVPEREAVRFDMDMLETGQCQVNAVLYVQ